MRVTCGHKIELNGTDVIDTAHGKLCPISGGTLLAMSTSPDLLRPQVIVDEIVHAPSSYVGGIVGHLRGENQARLQWEICRVKTGDVSDLHRAPRELNVGGFHARSQQDIIDVFIGVKVLFTSHWAETRQAASEGAPKQPRTAMKMDSQVCDHG